MTSSSVPSPRSVPQVMVSSTFTDLKEHRNALIQAISKHEMHPVGMEFSDAKITGDVVDASLGMVAKSAAYILIIGRKYGQTPDCPKRNPDKLSITELEYREAIRLNRPVLLFLMGEDHPRKESEIELDPEKRAKLAAFRELAKKSAPGTAVNRVYGTFESLEQLKEIIGAPLSEMQRHLEPKVPNDITQSNAVPSNIPKPPAIYAFRDYIGRHIFIGRKAQLQTLSDWAKPSDPTTIVLFEAIGGNGKSMLTWEWATKYATTIRTGNDAWLGRFWYSFYEKGAVMRDFCRHALAYMTEQPLEAFEKKSTPEMRTELLAQLHAKPWLLILDGLERVLVAYHRIDAAEVRDEDLNRPTDKILDRDPCDAIRIEDADLLRALAGKHKSKVLISSRLIPRALLNPSGLPLPGVRPLVLPGLDEVDAEALLRSCGVQGTSADIRYYLKTFCDNHPLVIGVLAGLINSPGPHRGKFDAWAADPAYGAKLNLASLDLIQSRNHILRAAMEALEPASRQLLSTLALLSDAVDYETVAAFNPHVSSDVKKLDETIKDLERRGMLQYDVRMQRYDMHPVVRGVAAGSMKSEDRELYGLRVVDHYSSQPHNPYEQAKTIEEVENGLHVVRTLLKLGHYQQAADAYRGDLARALLFNLEAHVETLALLRPFFPNGWAELPSGLNFSTASDLANIAGVALHWCGESGASLAAYSAVIPSDIGSHDWGNATVQIRNTTEELVEQGQFAKAIRLDSLALDLSEMGGVKDGIFKSLLALFRDYSLIGNCAQAEVTWQRANLMGRQWWRGGYRQGTAEERYARWQFSQRALQEDHLAIAETLAERDDNRATLRDLHRLRGAWRLEQGDWALAAASFTQAVTMARERRLVDAGSETGLALAKVHLGQLTGDEARSEAQRLAQLRQPAHRYLALLWQALDDLDQGKHHALAAYTWAWADGEPYVRRYELTQTTELLHELGVPIPNLPPYDPANDEPFPWEADVRAAIEKLKTAKAAKVT